MWFDTYGPLLLMHVKLILTTIIITMAELYLKEDMSLARPLPILPLVNSWLRPLLSFEMYNVHYLQVLWSINRVLVTLKRQE